MKKWQIVWLSIGIVFLAGLGLFYRHIRSNQILFVGNQQGSNDGFYRLNGAGGTPQLLYADYLSQPAWSPDGKKIAFVSSAGENGQPPYHIAVMDSRGKNIQILTAGETRQYSPTWSPDGTRIAFVCARDYRGGGPLAIFTIRADGSDMKQLTPYAYYNDLSWSPDGSQIAYFTFEPDGIFSLDVASGETHRLTDQWMDSAPAWSPDGQYVAFQSIRGAEDERFDIFVMRADGTDIRRLTHAAGHDRLPDWSPDGKKIIFESNRDSEDEQYHPYIMNADGSEQARLTELEGGSPVWRP